MGGTPLTAAVTVNVPSELPAVTLAETLPILSDDCVGGLTVAAVVGVTVHVTFAPLSGKPPLFSTVKPTDSVPPVSSESLSPKIPVTEPALGPVESPHASAKNTRQTKRAFMEPPLFGHDAVEHLAVSNHPELFARDALLDRGVGLEIMRQLGERIDIDP